MKQNWSLTWKKLEDASLWANQDRRILLTNITYSSLKYVFSSGIENRSE